MVKKSVLEAEEKKEKEEGEETELVEFKECEPVEFTVHIKGIRPLMFSKFPDKDAPKPVAGEIDDPKKSAEKALYRDKDGKIYLPAEHIEGALINAGKGMKIPGKGKKTYKDEIAQNIIVMPQNISFKSPKDPESYDIDERVVVMKGIGRRRSYRPRWDEWEFSFAIRYDYSFGNLIDKNVLTELFMRAGKIGIGTYRLKFGKFMPVSVIEVKK